MAGAKVSGARDAVVRAEDAPRGLPPAARRRRRRARASGHRHRLRRGRRAAQPRRAGRGHHDARRHSDRRVRHAVHGRTPGRHPRLHQGARRPAARQSRRAGGGRRSLHRLLPDGDHRALREDQPGGALARAREPAVARRSDAAAGPARDVRHQLAGAHLRRSGGAAGGADCQVVEAPASTARLVPDTPILPPRPPADRARHGRRDSANIRPADDPHRRGRQGVR